MFNYGTIALISHASKVMLKILQARLQHYMNRELPDVQAGLRKGRATRDQIANIRGIIEKARVFNKNIYFCFIDYAKSFDCVDHSKLWKILKEKGILDHLTCLLWNLYIDQEVTVRTGHGTMNWSPPPTGSLPIRSAPPSGQKHCLPLVSSRAPGLFLTGQAGGPITAAGLTSCLLTGQAWVSCPHARIGG